MKEKIKQVIAVRKDLNMRKGKMCAQTAHASMKIFFDRMKYKENDIYECDFSEDMREWVDGSFTKVVVGVNSEEEVLNLAKKAEELNLPFAIIIDNGFTEFRGNKTITCIAIGPGKESEIDKITRELSLI